MTIYRVSHLRLGQEHDGYSYFTNKKEAEKALKESRKNNVYEDGDEFENKSGYHDDIDELEIEISKSGIISFLNEHCSYANNG